MASEYGKKAKSSIRKALKFKDDPYAGDLGKKPLITDRQKAQQQKPKTRKKPTGMEYAPPPAEYRRTPKNPWRKP